MSQSAQKADRDNGKSVQSLPFLTILGSPILFCSATRSLGALRLDGQTTEALLGLICSSDPTVSDASRQVAAIQVKNLVKQAYGSSDSYRNYDDQVKN